MSDIQIWQRISHSLLSIFPHGAFYPSFSVLIWTAIVLCLIIWQKRKSGFRGLFPGKPGSITLDHWCLLGETWKKYSKSTRDRSSRLCVKHVSRNRGPKITLTLMSSYIITDDAKGNSSPSCLKEASSWCLSPHPAEQFTLQSEASLSMPSNKADVMCCWSFTGIEIVWVGIVRRRFEVNLHFNRERREVCLVFLWKYINR